MGYKHEELVRIYRRTDGYCHLCRTKLAFSNYGVVGAKGAWEVDHYYAVSHGGSDSPANLYAACIQCNRSRGNKPAIQVRQLNGFTHPPRSKPQKVDVRRRNTFLGAAAGFALGGPIGAFIGGIIGNGLDPDSK